MLICCRLVGLSALCLTTVSCGPVDSTSVVPASPLTSCIRLDPRRVDFAQSETLLR
ncbi:MAG: hypothetical protein ACI9MC_002231, partial [Kiritimatiellia bacterium]